jgi:predicted RNA-binding protein YlxR (DUF448 family)
VEAQTRVYLLRFVAEEEGQLRIEVKDEEGRVRYFRNLESMVRYLSRARQVRSRTRG